MLNCFALINRIAQFDFSPKRIFPISIGIATVSKDDDIAEKREYERRCR